MMWEVDWMGMMSSDDVIGHDQHVEREIPKRSLRSADSMWKLALWYMDVEFLGIVD